jgi:DNA-binding NtrC family response regulator
MARILLIDDDVDLAGELVHALERAGHGVTPLERAERGPDLLVRQEFDLVLLDNKMPGMSGIDFLTALNEREIRVPVILMTSFATADTAIRAVNLGACDYLEKPDNFELLCAELIPLIANALEIDWRPKQVVQVPGETAPDGTAGAPLLGKSKPMLELYAQIGRVARGHVPVLIRGETGTGKELVARAIHTNSPRKNRPFVAMNCTALNENLLEDELFGHEPHAFTGADKLRKGRFEHASGGTLFLDEVGDMPLSLQAKLLRVLENQEVARIGSNEPLKVDVRVLSATHRDLETAIHDGTFREDLFYRLNGVTIRLPALRGREMDLSLLVSHFLDQAAEGTGRRAPTLHPSAWDRLRAHPWPGNIRELRNVLSSAVLMCRGSQIMPCDLKLWGGAPDPAPRTPPGEADALAGMRQAIHWAWNAGQPNLWPQLQDLLERELLQHALAELDGNKSRVAERLNMNRGTVIKRLQAYGLE